MRFFTNKFPDYVDGNPVGQQQKKWTSSILSTIQTIVKKMPPKPENCDGGLYVGVAGVAYMFYRLSQLEQIAPHKDEMLKHALDYSNAAIKYIEKGRTRDPPSSFLLGAGGVFAVSSLIANQSGDQKLCKDLLGTYADLSKNCMSVNFLSCGSDELFVGRSGYLLGAQILNKHFGQVVGVEEMRSLYGATIKSGQEYSSKRKLQCPLMYAYYDTEYIGAAHGVSAILLVLMLFPEFIKSDASTAKDIRSSVDFILSLKQKNGNYPQALDEVGERNRRPEKEELVHWCHGAPGVVYMFARAYIIWKDERYLQACIECSQVSWEKGLLKKGPGICHGVAGSGYVHLLLYRLTGDVKYLYRAEKFGEFLFSQEFNTGARIPDSPYSLYEGLAGTVCFLADLLEPNKSSFPFFDVFV